jgi:glycosyltransferase involved in cell wall biosynthesis
VDAPRIAFVSRSYYPDDPRLQRQARALLARGASVHVVCLRRPGTDEPGSEVVEGVEVTRLGGTRKRAGKLRYVLEYGTFFAAAGLVLAREHARRRFALVQVANPPDALLFCAAPLHLAGAAVVLDIHDLSPELYASKFGEGGESWPPGARIMAALERAATRIADHVLIAGEPFREALIARGVPPTHVTSIPNGPDESLFHEGIRDHREPDRLVYHGSLFDRYGFLLAIEALPQIRRVRPNVRLDVWGDGPELPLLKERAAELGLNGAVRFHGVTPLSTIPELVANASCGLSTLRRDCFTDLAFPTKVWEYAQLGVPVAASRTRALAEAVPDDAAAYYEPGDAAGLAAAVLRVLDDPAAADRQAVRARAAAQSYVWSRHAPRYAALILGLAGQRRAA